MIDFFIKNSLRITLFIFIVFTISQFTIYDYRTLGGNVDNAILASNHFGVPNKLKEKGVKPLYNKETGWDGQFYYYMSNDILGNKDTAEHLDTPAYRYQRIGFSLFSNIVSKILFQDWVSPKLYLFCYFLLCGCAVFLGSKLLNYFGLSSYWMLFWGLSLGTQITMYNGLPDAAADAFLIIALYYFICSRKLILSIIFFTFSSLSREIYTLFPSVLFLLCFINDFFNNKKSATQFLTDFKSLFLLVPGIVTVLWHIYIRVHFPDGTNSIDGILGKPLLNLYEYLNYSFHRNHPIWGSGKESVFEGISLLLFFFMLLFSIYISIKHIILNINKLEKYFINSIAITLIIFSCIYLSFGPIVMMHYTGYMKTLSIFYVLIPMFLILNNSKLASFLGFTIILVTFLFTGYFNYKARIEKYEYDSIRFSSVTHMKEITKPPQKLCRDDIKYSYSINSIEIYRSSFIARIVGVNNVMKIDLTMKNLSNHEIYSNVGFGSINVSYQWVNEKSEVVADGMRTAILDTIEPGETFNTSIIVKMPPERNLYLIPSLVQEGCYWSYRKYPSESNNKLIKVY